MVWSISWFLLFWYWFLLFLTGGTFDRWVWLVDGAWPTLFIFTILGASGGSLDPGTGCWIAELGLKVLVELGTVLPIPLDLKGSRSIGQSFESGVGTSFVLERAGSIPNRNWHNSYSKAIIWLNKPTLTTAFIRGWGKRNSLSWGEVYWVITCAGCGWRGKLVWIGRLWSFRNICVWCLRSPTRGSALLGDMFPGCTFPCRKWSDRIVVRLIRIFALWCRTHGCSPFPTTNTTGAGLLATRCFFSLASGKRLCTNPMKWLQNFKN